MAFCQLNYHSNALGKSVAVNIILPEANFKGPFPVFYLLHGRGDDHSIWVRRTSIERYASAWPLIIVMPDGGRGFYVDAVEGFAYESAIVRDLIPYIDGTFNTVAERDGRCIGGLSMGGYGALRLALRFPETFCSANSHSGALEFGHSPVEWAHSDDKAELERITGPNPRGSEYDLYALAEKTASANLPALQIDCGTEDFLIEQNRAFHRHLEQLQVAHEYAKYSGAHNWEYWDAHIQDALRFHARHLGFDSA